MAKKKNEKELEKIAEETVSEEEELEYLTLDFDGEEVHCAIIDEFLMDGKRYIVLYPDDEEDAYIYSYTEDEDGELELFNLDDEEFEKAVNLFNSRLEKSD